MKTILCLTDFSPTANHAANYGYYIAKCLEAQIILCNIINVPAEISQYEVVLWGIDNYDKIKKESTNALNKLKKKIEHNDYNIDFQPLISCICESGVVTTVANSIIKDRDVDLIIMGTHTKTGLNHLLLGNHVRYMIELTTISLLLVPPKAEISKVHWIAFATDFSLEDFVATTQLIEVAKFLDLEIILMHVLNTRNKEVSATKQEQFLSQLYKSTDYHRISYQSDLNKSIPKGLEKLCLKNKNNGLLAIVHRKRKQSLNEIFKGNQTQKIAKRLSLPLLIIPLC